MSTECLRLLFLRPSRCCPISFPWGRSQTAGCTEGDELGTPGALRNLLLTCRGSQAVEHEAPGLPRLLEDESRLMISTAVRWIIVNLC
ncbi:Uncharacterized protein DAT39_018518, partial [Clarias magur]